MNRLRRVQVCVLACGLFAIVGSTACDEKLSDLTGPSPNLTVSFSSIRSEVLETTDAAGRRACVSCHNTQGRQFAGQLNLQVDPYAALVNVPSRFRSGATLVIPGDPNNSYLVRKLEGRDINGVRMPQSGPPYLTDGQIRVIRRWIELGAPNN